MFGERSGVWIIGHPYGALGPSGVQEAPYELWRFRGPFGRLVVYKRKKDFGKKIVKSKNKKQLELGIDLLFPCSSKR